VDKKPLYLRRILSLAKRCVTDVRVVDPWSKELTNIERAQILFELVDRSYKGSYSFRDFIPDIVNLTMLYDKEEFLTWLVYWQGYPVGASSVEFVTDYLASLASSVNTPIGYELDKGQMYKGEAKISIAMYQRIADLLLREDYRESLMVIEGDVRMSQVIRFPEGSVLLGGARSQHINRLCELSPYLICVPRFHLHLSGKASLQQFFMQSRKYLQEEFVEVEAPIYSPTNYPNLKVTIPDIVTTTYKHSWGVAPTFIDSYGDYLPEKSYCRLTRDGTIQYSTLHASGEVTPAYLKSIIERGLNYSRFVEIIVPNKPYNIGLQISILNLGAIPLGALPGIRKSKHFTLGIDTTLHYGLLRRDAINELVDIELARDYEGSEVEKIALLLREEWGRRGSLTNAF
jgi:hypothetical protein